MNKVEMYAELLLNAARELESSKQISDYTAARLEETRKLMPYEDRIRSIQLMSKMIQTIEQTKSK